MKKVENYELKKTMKKKLKPYIKLDKKTIEFDNTRIEKYEFHQYKSPILIKDIDINEIVISNKICFGKQDFKYFIGYKVAKKIKPLCIFCSRMSMYKRDFFIKMKICLDIYNEIWENVSNIIKKKIIGELMYDEKFLKAEKKN